ncbi:carboxypeptidase-like regulatory domain-containing protein [Spirosoma pollinicola]|uniref:Carboxypeptidase-like regulatory domain-containing protein n=1 Tax=Spirosoma pollinicola TaxID=2057025 RepID=A0A2K8Z9K9_9BACT|nr:carboxypeptidase-like regulatory domain-containing protein [Spirosoma pollinicola]AUD06547.1 hypothetical protein CWM47_34685 [Spirosoma pollinicola]
MKSEEAGRFCDRCQKTVIDFTSMSDQQIVAYFATAEQHVCGRFTANQLNRNLVSTPTSPTNSITQRWLGLIATGLISWSTAHGQSGRLPEPNEPVSESIRQESTVKTVTPPTLVNETIDSVWVIEGRVAEKNGDQPLPGVNVFVKDIAKGTSTDAAGLFKLTLSDYQPDKLVLTISSVGFIAQEITMTATSKRQLTIALAEDSAMLDEVVYIGYATVQKKPTFIQKLRRRFKTRQ